MRLIYEIGDKVKVVVGWRDWEIGNTATVTKWEFESGISGLQILTLEDGKKHDFYTLYAYNVELIDP